MTRDSINERHIIADEGKVFQRLSDGCIMGTEIWLGYNYYIDGNKLDTPILEVPEHFQEVDYEEVDDTPVEIPETTTDEQKEPTSPITEEEPEAASPAITMGELRRLQVQVNAMSAMSKSVINDFALPEEVALTVQELYPEWGNLLGKSVSAGFRFRYKGTLFEVVQPHTLQAGWIPDDSAMAMYKVVTIQNEEESGTAGNPIGWMQGMELQSGKYYTDNGVLYLCIRNSGMPMSYGLKDLVAGGFVEVIET